MVAYYRRQYYRVAFALSLKGPYFKDLVLNKYLFGILGP